MKNQLKKIALVLITLAFASCSNDDNQTNTNELDGLTKFKEVVEGNQTIEFYSPKGALSQGYNDIKFRIKNNETNQYITDAQVEWMPKMHMTMMTHSCPKSEVVKAATGNLYEGYIVFQMAQNETEYWDLTLDYSIDGEEHSLIIPIDVPATAKRVVSSFMGSDNVRYVIAYIDPTSPKVGMNDLKVGIWKMQDMMTFPMINDYTVKIDPRMPSMGNHSSPNNVNAQQTAVDNFYIGKLSLTMTGYWKINLQLQNDLGTIVKGEEITDSVTESSLFFEIEF
ncbi:MAG: hypothetical protein R2805_12420 [Flavobacterium sp.]|jgi:hypothetical protein|uniref:hypothetical protein n=1 Tax=Flavobacterium sp. TaxID=239 RepID=UPI002C768067|nr:hypothetical protein [Flavobacterium sp.]MCA0348645.1 hypothetical protein [Bacteroidota bacterium]HQA75220.1 hypothetical protein [Flavobacterium sp.]